MFLKSYWKFLKIVLFSAVNEVGTYNANFKYWRGANGQFYDINGNVHDYFIIQACIQSPNNGSNLASQSAYVGANKRLNYGWNVRFGTGTTPTTGDEYQLESETSDIVGSMTSAAGDDPSSMSTILVITGENTSASSITLTELGFTKTIYYVTDNTSTSNTVSSCNVLLMRYLLQTPIVLAPTESFTLTLEVKNI